MEFTPRKTTTPHKTKVIELNVISAQQLFKKSKPTKNIQTYVVARINPNQKLTTRVNNTLGDSDPTWNDNFIFTVDSDSINPSSTMVFEIYAVRRFRKDKRIGSVNVLIESLIGKGKKEAAGAECMAFHVRRPNGEPRGILNIGVIRVNAMFHEALSCFVDSGLGVDYRKLTGEDIEKDMKACRVLGLNSPPYHLVMFSPALALLCPPS